MPWSGGVYTRGYPSWTNDANSNLPISATKFDLEDNDFAAGLNNCLTIDGLNKPNATLNWAQTLTLTRTDASTVLSIGHTGGTNNPALAFSAVDSTGTILAALSGTNANLQVSGPVLFSGAGISTNTVTGFSAGTAAAGSVPDAKWINSAGGTDSKVWDFFADTTTLHGRVINDANTTGKDWIAILRTANVVTSLSFGNATDNPSYTFLGTGLVSANDQGGTSWNLGWRDCPQNAQTGSYQLVLADRGKQVYFSVSGATLTIPANASVAFPLGTTILVAASGAGSLSIAITTDTLFLAGLGTTGTRTLAAFGLATLTKVVATGWFISGSGIS